ncbi:MAG: ROK family protein [Bacillota bacterium]|nr:ROK family protein [Bacillota bacterium]
MEREKPIPIVDLNGYPCTCGNHGCLKTVASATGVVWLDRNFSEEFAVESKLKWLVDDGQKGTSKTVFVQAKRGDKFLSFFTKSDA